MDESIFPVDASKCWMNSHFLLYSFLVFSLIQDLGIKFYLQDNLADDVSVQADPRLPHTSDGDLSRSQHPQGEK